MKNVNPKSKGTQNADHLLFSDEVDVLRHAVWYAEYSEKFLGPVVWAALIRHIWETQIKDRLLITLDKEALSKSAVTFSGSEGSLFSIAQPMQTPARAPKPVKKRRQPPQIVKGMEFPPELDVSILKYMPPKLRSIPRHHEAIAIRREFIVEMLKKQKVVTMAEIVAHLEAAGFPVGDEYYSKQLQSGEVRLLSSINNDLVYFTKRKWIRRVGANKWHWLRPATFYTYTPPEAEVSEETEQAPEALPAMPQPEQAPEVQPPPVPPPALQPVAE